MPFILSAQRDGPYLAFTKYGHRDWRYDEFRLSKHGGVEHEIERCGPTATGTWLIEAAAVEYRWLPFADA